MLSGWIAPSSANALWSIFFLLVTAGVTVLGYAIKTWPAVKAKVTEAKLADEQIAGSSQKRWQDEIARLDARIHTLEEELSECRRAKHDAENRAMVATAEKARLEGFIAGRLEGQDDARERDD